MDIVCNIKASTNQKAFAKAFSDDDDGPQNGGRSNSENEIHGIGDIRLSSIGKMLAVTFEVNGPKTAVLVERHLRNRLTQPLLWLICNR